MSTTATTSFEYYDVGSTAETTTPVKLIELATNIVTDWAPGTPNPLAQGFSGLLGTMLEPKFVGSSNLWVVNKGMAEYEKQWKQVTSWILGVAFCRKVMQNAGYPWWAPVSAFTSSSRAKTALTKYWAQSLLPAVNCKVQRSSSASSKLLPDYVLARTSISGSGYEVSFAESKGCVRSLKNLSTVPKTWKDQAESAEFLHLGTLITPTQTLVVATRVNPAAKRTGTRRVQVRAWNSRNPESRLPFEAYREILLTHYFGVCERLAMTANAQLLSLSNSIYLDKSKEEQLRLFEQRERLMELAQEEVRTELMQVLPDEQIAFGNTPFTAGRITFRVGFTSTALRTLRWLQSGDMTDGQDIMRKLEGQMAAVSHQMIDNPNIFIRNDGVTGQILEFK